jgi:hypothetical protein
MGEAEQRREVAEAGRAFGVSLAGSVIDRLGLAIRAEHGDMVASVLGEAILQEVREMHAGGMPTPLAILWADECFKGLRDGIGRHVSYLGMLHTLERLDVATALKN